MPLEPVPFRVRRSRTPQQPPSAQTYPALDSEKLFGSLLAGLGLAASISAASVLQFLYPSFRAGNLPLGAVIGLLLGWTLAWPVVKILSRVLDPSRMWRVAIAAMSAGLALAVPAFFCAGSIGWTGSPIALLALGILLGGSGLVWGGYLDFDNPANF